MITSPLERQKFRKANNLVECVACGGSAVASNGNECRGCGGTGAQGGSKVVHHSSKSNEHYTPEYIVEPGRELMGAIDLDPASCPMAQEVVRAEAWYGPGSEFGEDGLAEPWCGRVFLNPPGGSPPDEYKGMGTQSFATLWWMRLVEEWRTGEVEQAIFVGFTLEIMRSTQGLGVPSVRRFPDCVPSSRIPFDTINTVREKGKKAGELIDPSAPAGARVSGTQPAHANVIVYLPSIPVLYRHDAVHDLESWEVPQFVKLYTPVGECRT